MKRVVESIGIQNYMQGSYSVWNTLKSMEFNFPFSKFKVMNSWKFRDVVWKSMDFGSFEKIFSSGAKLLYASIFFMQFDKKFS